MSTLERQISAIKDIYNELKKTGSKIEPILMGKFALTVYTQGMYPASNISLLFPDLELLYKVLKDLGYSQLENFWIKGDIVLEINRNFEIIPTARFNKVEIEGFYINVLSLEDLLLDMMKQCLEGDFSVCDLIKILIKSYKPYLDFHYIYRNCKTKQEVAKFNELRKDS